MRRAALIFMLVVLVAAALSAQTASTGASDRASGNGVKLDVSTQVTPSIFAAYWSMNPSAAYRFGRFGVGAGVKSFVGLSHPGIYLGPYLRLEYGWFYLGAGPLFLFEQTPQFGWATVDGDRSSLGLVGASIPVVKLGPGSLGIDAGLEFSITSPKIAVSSDAVNFFTNTLTTMISSDWGFAVSATKLNVGILYSVAP